jgi:organic hydroperoxide reductase OsmC/OhrA
VIKRIHVRMLLQCTPEQRETAERVHGFYAQSCPVYRSIHPQIAVTTELRFV